MKRALLLSICISLLSLCGCTGYKEIDRGYLATAIGFEKRENEYHIIVEAIASSDVSDKSSKRQLLSGKGESLQGAFSCLEEQLVKPIYFEQLGTAVIDASLNDGSLYQIVSFCSKLQSASRGLYIVETNDIKALFEADTGSTALGYDVIGIIKNFYSKQSEKAANQLYQIERRLSKGETVSLPQIDIVDNQLKIKAAGEKSEKSRL